MVPKDKKRKEKETNSEISEKQKHILKHETLKPKTISSEPEDEGINDYTIHRFETIPHLFDREEGDKPSTKVIRS